MLSLFYQSHIRYAFSMFHFDGYIEITRIKYYHFDRRIAIIIDKHNILPMDNYDKALNDMIRIFDPNSDLHYNNATNYDESDHTNDSISYSHNKISWNTCRNGYVSHRPVPDFYKITFA